MEWLANTSLRFMHRPMLNSGENCDPAACYDSFKGHWSHAYKIIKRSQSLPSHDDVLAIVNHLEQMFTLLLYDFKRADHIAVPVSNISQCTEYLLSENILDKLYEWGKRTGKYINAVRSEQLKLYGILLNHSRHLLFIHEPFTKPLLKLLNSCHGDVFQKDFEKSLVALVYQLCVLLVQNVELLDLFFPKDEHNHKFIIFLLLMPFVHREDSTGMQARDALLLSISLSKKNRKVATYILEHSNLCAFLASGLSGLYSLLPHVLNDITVPDWHRLTPDDVNDIKDLSTFVTSLEFSNALAQVSHGAIKKQLQDFLYRGFLIPVLGPALLQTTVGERVTASAYLELILRTVTQPGLLFAVLQFLLQIEYDGQRLLHILVQRINVQDSSQVGLVTLALFETIVELNCEDMMLELVFQHLQPCLHLMLSQRRMMFSLDPYCHSFEKLLSLMPSCCETLMSSPRVDTLSVQWNHYGGQQSLYGNYHAYLVDARYKIANCHLACGAWTGAYKNCESAQDTLLEDSLSSLGESSGYESLKIKLEEQNEDSGSFQPIWQCSQGNNKSKPFDATDQLPDSSEPFDSSATVGPFLTAILEKLKNMLSNTFYVNLHVTGLISKLAIYSQPLLRTYLLDHTLVLQPNVPSLFQIIGLLKQRIDEYMSHKSDYKILIRQARNFLLEREIRLVNARRNVAEKAVTSAASSDVPETFQQESSRRSFTLLPSFSTLFTKKPSQFEANIPMIKQCEENEQAFYPKFNEAQHVALCAVLLEEWVKELAAIAQEHTIAQLTILFK